MLCSITTRGWWKTAWPRAMPSTSLSPASCAGPASRAPAPRAGALVDQPGGGDQLGEHHRDGLQRLDLDIVVAARLASCWTHSTPTARSRRTIGTPAKLWNSSSPVSGL